MKIFLLAPNENWICDSFVSQWYENNQDITTKNPYEADIIWLVSDWTWNQLPYELLKRKKVITSVHHLVPNKFLDKELQEFASRDSITDAYHVPCLHSEKQVKQVLEHIGSNKSIISRPFWVNQQQWKKIDNIDLIGQNYLGSDYKNFHWIMSAQRDTEGNDLKSPKLEKGPDQFCDVVEFLYKSDPTIKVLLSGWRRQYVINRLIKAKIPYVYIERPNNEVINQLYNLSWLYIVASRYEGGPQSIVECAAIKKSIISTDVGLAPEILHSDNIFNINSEKSIKDAVENSMLEKNIEYAFNSVKEHFLQPSFKWFRNFIKESL